MQLSIKEIFTAFMVLFAVIDIVGNIPIGIDLRRPGKLHLGSSPSLIDPPFPERDAGAADLLDRVGI